VREHLDERVLDGFVGVCGIAEILVGDSKRPALMAGDEVGEPLSPRSSKPRISTASSVSPELCGGVVRRTADPRFSGATGSGAVPSTRRVIRSFIKKLRWARKTVYSLPHRTL
jgi:hypothetical protein